MLDDRKMTYLLSLEDVQTPTSFGLARLDRFTVLDNDTLVGVGILHESAGQTEVRLLLFHGCFVGLVRVVLFAPLI